MDTRVRLALLLFALVILLVVLLACGNYIYPTVRP